MSLKITNRLDQIESDIRVMMMLRKCGNITRTNTVLSIPDNNLVSYECSNERHQIGTFRRGTSLPPIEQDNCISTPPEYVIASPRQYYNYHSHSRHSISDFDNRSYTYSNALVEEIKPYCKKQYFSPGLELEYEQAKRRKLQEEVTVLKGQVISLIESKGIAVTMTKQLKKKYEKVNGALEETNHKLTDMSKEKDFLCKCLEREQNLNSAKATPISKSAMTSQLDDISSTSVGVETDQENDENLKSLQESVQNLSKQVDEKTKEKQNLQSEMNKLEMKLKKKKEVNRRLTDVNQKMSNCIKIKQENFVAVKNKANKYEKDIENYKADYHKSQIEIQRLNEALQTERSKIAIQNSENERLIEELNLSKEREKCLLESIHMLNQKVNDIEKIAKEETQMEIDRLKKESEMAQASAIELAKKLTAAQEEESKVLKLMSSCQQIVPLNLQTSLQSKIMAFLKHIEGQKRKIDELESFKNQLSIVINSQTEQLMSKEEEIRLQEDENDILRKKCLDLDKQLEVLQSAVETKEVQTSEDSRSSDIDKVILLENKIEELRYCLEKERALVVEKDKIICDRSREMESLRKLTGELKDSRNKLEITIRELAKEKEAAKKVADGLDNLTLKKEKLEDMMADLEGACQKLLLEKDQYIIICNQLENELNAEKKLRLLERHTLEEERNKVYEVARLAALTLIETVDDYELLTESQSQLKRGIRNIITNKQQNKHLVGDQFRTGPSNNSPTPSIIDVKTAKDVESGDETSSSECGLCNETKPGTESTEIHHCLTGRVVQSKGAMEIQIPITAVNPYKVPSALIATSPYAYWLKDYSLLQNKGCCKLGYSSSLQPFVSPVEQQHIQHTCLQQKREKTRLPVRVTSRKSTCVCPKKKRFR